MKGGGPAALPYSLGAQDRTWAGERILNAGYQFTEGVPPANDRPER